MPAKNRANELEKSERIASVTYFDKLTWFLVLFNHNMFKVFLALDVLVKSSITWREHGKKGLVSYNPVWRSHMRDTVHDWVKFLIGHLNINGNNKNVLYLFPFHI